METLTIDRIDFEFLRIGRCISVQVPHDGNLVVASLVRTDCGISSLTAEIVMARQAPKNTMLVVLKKYPPT